MNRSPIQLLFISIISVVLCVQLTLLPSRTALWQNFSKDRPRLKLPIASHGTKIACFGHSITELSLNRQDQWVTRGEASMDELQLSQYLDSDAKKQSSRGRVPLLRLRIPAQSPAKHFIHVTRKARDAGFQDVYLAVWKPKPYKKDSK